MARKPRVHYEGALYHVICRGNGGDSVLEKTEEKAKYLEILRNYKKRYKFKVYAYCVMDNHVHILIEVEKTPLSKIMQGVQQVYTMYYNKKLNRSGHVFQQRYKGILCNKDEYLFSLLRYIHQNPVRAGIEKGIDYEWSSHRIYKKGQKDALLDVESTLKFFSNNKKRAIERYLSFVEDKDIKIDGMKDLSFSEGINIIKIEESQGNQKVSIEEIIKKTCDVIKIDEKEIGQKLRTKELVKCRKVIIILSKQFSDTSNKELGLRLNLSEPTVSNILSDQNNHEKLRDIIEEIKKVIKL